jgi:hypothetical protein
MLIEYLKILLKYAIITLLYARVVGLMYILLVCLDYTVQHDAAV